MRSNGPDPKCRQVAATIAHRGPIGPRRGTQALATGSSVHKATLADAPRLAQALASAFQDDPVITWVFPDRQRRRALLPAFMEFRLRKLAFPHDEVWMTADGAAAAVWLPPPGRWQLSRPQRLQLLPPLVRFLVWPLWLRDDQ